VFSTVDAAEIIARRIRNFDKTSMPGWESLCNDGHLTWTASRAPRIINN